MLELLAGIPTIVYGYLALLLVTPVLEAALRAARAAGRDLSTRLSACIVVGMMIIPLVSSLSEDVLSAVPRGLREAAYGLGATKFEVSTRVVLPGRSLGGVRLVHPGREPGGGGDDGGRPGGRAAAPDLTLNPLTSIETMTTYIVQVIGGDASYGEPKYLSLFAVGLTLFAITLTLNIISGLVLRRYREVYQ